jgi:hypothetical protein
MKYVEKRINVSYNLVRGSIITIMLFLFVGIASSFLDAFFVIYIVLIDTECLTMYYNLINQ